MPPEPLDPKDLTPTQQNIVIEHLKYSEALSNVEIAHYIKLHRFTIRARLHHIDKELKTDLEEKGISVWDAVYELKRACAYAKKLARIKGDGYLYLKAELAFITQCQKLGVIYEKPTEIDVFTYPQHDAEDERTIIRYYQDEQRKTATLLKTREEEAKAEVVELVPANKEG